MIQLAGFIAAKEMARLPYGRHSGQHFNYNADLQKRWDTAADSRVALTAVGSLGMARDNLGDVKAWLGDLTEEERLFKVRFEDLYRRVAALTTTAPVVIDTDPDFYETLLDTRVLRQHVTAPRCLLDIGPGAGRHLASLMLRPWGTSSAYVGVESVGLPYMLQNLVGAVLALQDPSCQFRDQLEHETARAEFPIASAFGPRTVWHVPLWRADLVSSRAADVIVCNYVLDELSAPDFIRVMDLMVRCLAPDGVIYCRGGQERSMVRDLYQFGYGTFHQCDITAAFVERGLRVKSCDLVASALTRVFVGAESTAHAIEPGRYTSLTSDVELVQRLQQDYVADVVAEMHANRTPVIIWADPGYDALSRLLEPHLPRLNVVAVTNEHINGDAPGPFGLRQVPLSQVSALRPRAAIIAGYRTQLAMRELHVALRPGELGPVRQFTRPFAHAAVKQAR